MCGSTRSRLSCPQGTLLPLRTWLGEGRQAHTLRKTKLSAAITTTQKKGLDTCPLLLPSACIGLIASLWVPFTHSSIPCISWELVIETTASIDLGLIFICKVEHVILPRVTQK